MFKNLEQNWKAYSIWFQDFMKLLELELCCDFPVEKMIIRINLKKISILYEHNHLMSDNDDVTL